MNMRDYKIVEDNDQYFLACFDEELNLIHRIAVPTKDSAHKHRLALGLGTHPSPQANPSYYELIGHEPLTYKVIQEYQVPKDDSEVSACCHSGCPTCPWAS